MVVLEYAGVVWIPSRFGRIGLGWRETGKGILIARVWLPASRQPSHDTCPPEKKPALVKAAEDQIRKILGGEKISVDPDMLDWSVCSDFQIQVLRAEFAIPYGSISTYGRIAAAVGSPGGARAVGNMLSSNPFPLFIPCHRAVRSTGELGGFQGGLKMKRFLLESEGVDFLPNGSVRMDTVYY
jgi:O-6-methylguanine DNA methyltransferase